MSAVLPVFYDHSSHKSINVFWDDKDITPDGPQSIIKMCKEANLSKCVFISNNFHTYVEALKICEKSKIELVFGLEVLMCQDSSVHAEESVATNHKLILMGKNSQSYFDLCNIFTAWQTDTNNKYYEYRFDYKQLKQYWTENLFIVFPFFDNPIATNFLVDGSNIIPDFPTKDIVIWREQRTDHPHEGLINYALNNFNKDKAYFEVPTKTILYPKREDAKAWLVYRTIDEKSEFSKPELPYCCSDRFSFEDYKELI